MDFFFKRIYRGPLKAVILDWAGTTIDHGCLAPAGVFQKVFADRGVMISSEQAREPMGLHKRDHIRAITLMPPVASAWKQVHGRECRESDIEEMFIQFIPLQLSVLEDFAELTPGTADTVGWMRERGIKIGTTTGYNREMLDFLLVEAARRGYRPDAASCASEVPQGRPAPWMIYRNLEALGVFPVEACVKIGDTPADVEEGLSAGMWTIGLSRVGNEVGLSEEEVSRLRPEELAARLARAERRLQQSGAHFIVESMEEVPAILEKIEESTRAGERP
jgi:phosphonoacetaldehyde hydrolase